MQRSRRLTFCVSVLSLRMRFTACSRLSIPPTREIVSTTESLRILLLLLVPTSPRRLRSWAMFVWKPSSTSVLTNFVMYKIFLDSGVPPGVISFLAGDGKVVGEAINHSDFAGLNSSGSTAVLNKLWQQIRGNLGKCKNYPRILSARLVGKAFASFIPQFWREGHPGTTYWSTLSTTLFERLSSTKHSIFTNKNGKFTP